MNAPILTSLLLTGALHLAGTSTVAAGEISLDMFQSDSGNFYVHAVLDAAIETDMLLDTGSGYVSLSKETFDRLAKTDAPQFSRHIYGTMANGKVEKVPLYVLDELRLADNCVLKEVEVAVFAKADRNILGLNVLARLQPFTFHLSPAKLTSSGCAS